MAGSALPSRRAGSRASFEENEVVLFAFSRGALGLRRKIFGKEEVKLGIGAMRELGGGKAWFADAG